MAQKVVIPKGLVNPTETTIIEIPGNLQNVATVVARPMASRSSPYQSFRPRAASSPVRESSPARRGQSIRSTFQGTPESYYSRSVSSGSPRGTTTEITEESSYYEPASMTPEDLCACGGDESSGGYQNFDSSDSGAYRRFDSSEDSGGFQDFGGLSPPVPQRRVTPNDVMDSLRELEQVELKKIMDNLNKFQQARRVLVQEASNLPTASDLSNMVLRQ